MQRRHFLTGLATSSAVALAGCSSDDDGGGGGGGGGGDFADSGGSGDGGDSSGDSGGSTSQTIVEDNDTVTEGSYRYYTFTLNRQATLDLRLTVRSGPAIDAIFTNPDEFDHFENGDRFRYNEDLSLLDSTGGDASGTFPAGEYVYIVDNTSAGDAQPPTNMDDDPVTYDIKIVARA